MTGTTGRPKWGLDDRNWCILCRDGEPVGMLIDPEVTAVIARTMNGEHERDEQLRAKGAADAVRDNITAALRDAYADSGDPGLMRAGVIVRGYIKKRAETAVELPAGPGR